MPSRLLNLRKGEHFQETLRFAVFGTGYWSTLQIPAWYELGGVELVACYNRTRSRGEAVAERFHIPKVYDDAEALLRQEEIDFMDIITEIPAHAPIVKLAAKYRIPVICQKPMGPDYETCQEMVSVCDEARIPFFIHENYRWQLPFRAVKQALDEGHIGRPHRAHIQLANGGYYAYFNQPFLKTLKHCALTDMGSHIFDLARFFFREAQSVACLTHKANPELTGEDNFSALLKIGNVMCTCDIGEFFDNRVFIEGENGWIVLNKGNQLTIQTRQETIVRNTTTWPHHPWVSIEDENFHGGDCIHSIYLCNQHLLDGLQTGQEPETSGKDNLNTARLVFAAIEAAEENKVVRV